MDDLCKYGFIKIKKKKSAIKLGFFFSQLYYYLLCLNRKKEKKPQKKNEPVKAVGFFQLVRMGISSTSHM